MSWVFFLFRVNIWSLQLSGYSWVVRSRERTCVRSWVFLKHEMLRLLWTSKTTWLGVAGQPCIDCTADYVLKCRAAAAYGGGGGDEACQHFELVIDAPFSSLFRGVGVRAAVCSRPDETADRMTVPEWLQQILFNIKYTRRNVYIRLYCLLKKFDEIPKKMLFYLNIHYYELAEDWWAILLFVECNP